LEVISCHEIVCPKSIWEKRIIDTKDFFILASSIKLKYSLYAIVDLMFKR